MIYINIFILLTLPATHDLIQLNVNTFTYTYEIFLLDNNNLFTEFIIQPISVSCIKNKHWSNTSEDVGAITINQKILKKGKKDNRTKLVKLLNISCSNSPPVDSKNQIPLAFEMVSEIISRYKLIYISIRVFFFYNRRVLD